MKTNIGEAGTEQFTVTIRVDGIMADTHPIHDPFIRSFTTTTLSRWEHFKRVFRNRPTVTQVSIDGSEGASRAIMTLDPVKLQKDTDEILAERKKIREENGVMGFYAETPNVG